MDGKEMLRWKGSRRAWITLSLTVALLLSSVVVIVAVYAMTASTSAICLERNDMAWTEQPLLSQTEMELSPKPKGILAPSIINVPTYTLFLPSVSNAYTSEPAPYPWTGEIVDAFPNCGLTRLYGYTLDRNGGLAGDIWVHCWADGWDGVWAHSRWIYTGEGNWDVILDAQPRAGVWHVCVVSEEGGWDCLSNVVDAVTSADCENGVQVVMINFRQN